MPLHRSRPQRWGKTTFGSPLRPTQAEPSCCQRMKTSNTWPVCGSSMNGSTRRRRQTEAQQAGIDPRPALAPSLCCGNTVLHATLTRPTRNATTNPPPCLSRPSELRRARRLRRGRQAYRGTATRATRASHSDNPPGGVGREPTRRAGTPAARLGRRPGPGSAGRGHGRTERRLRAWRWTRDRRSRLDHHRQQRTSGHDLDSGTRSRQSDPRSHGSGSHRHGYGNVSRPRGGTRHHVPAANRVRDGRRARRLGRPRTIPLSARAWSSPRSLRSRERQPTCGSCRTRSAGFGTTARSSCRTATLRSGVCRSWPTSTAATTGCRSPTSRSRRSPLGELRDSFVYVIPSFRSEPLRYGDSIWVSEGNSSHWDYDVDDALALINVAIETVPEAKPDSINLFGGSRGGGVALLAGVRDERIARIVTFFGPTYFLDDWVREIAREAALRMPRRLTGVAAPRLDHRPTLFPGPPGPRRCSARPGAPLLRPVRRRPALGAAATTVPSTLRSTSPRPRR